MGIGVFFGDKSFSRDCQLDLMGDEYLVHILGRLVPSS